MQYNTLRDNMKFTIDIRGMRFISKLSEIQRTNLHIHER